MRKFYAKLGVECEIEKCENKCGCLDLFRFVKVINEAKMRDT